MSLTYRKTQDATGKWIRERTSSPSRHSSPAQSPDSPPAISTIGTQLREIIEKEINRTLTCADCLGFLRGLNQQAEHDHDAIVKHLHKHFPWPHDWRKKNPEMVAAISALIAPVVPAPVKVESINIVPRRLVSSSIVWGVAINAAPRAISSLQETVDSLTEQGWLNPLVFAEPGTESATDCQLVYRPATIAEPVYTGARLGPDGKFGAWQNFVQTLADMLVAFPDANALLYVQDDVKFSPGTKQLLERDLWPSQRTGIVSPYCANYRGYRSETPELRRITEQNLMGALCYAMPREAVEELLRIPLCQDWKGAARGSIQIPHERKALDAFAGHAMRKVNRKVFFYTHSMCEHFAPQGNHLGNSAVNNGNNVGFRKEFARVTENACDHFPQPWVRWNPAGEQEFSTPRPAADRLGPVSVIVPGYGLPDVTIECLTALAESTIDVRLVYVDNGSEPEDWQRVKAFAQQMFHRTTLIRNDANKGFTYAVNQGLAANPNHHVLILNNDCRVSPTAIENMLTHLEWHPKVASVSPTTNDSGICSLKRSENQLACGINTPTSLADTQSALTRCRVIPRDVLPWFCCLLHRDALQLVPSLPEAAEVASGLAVDDWWSQRLSKAGWMHLQVCDAYAEHDHRTTFRAAGVNRRKEQRKAEQWLKKHQ